MKIERSQIRVFLLWIMLLLPAIAQAQFTTTTNGDGSLTITGYTGSGGAVNIPDQINGQPVTGIGNSAFFFCTSLTSITIPSSVTSIGDEAFFGTSLTSVTIPGSVTNVGKQAFSYCTSLVSFVIPNSINMIGNYEFAGDSGLISVTICATSVIMDTLFWKIG